MHRVSEDRVDHARDLLQQLRDELAEIECRTDWPGTHLRLDVVMNHHLRAIARALA